MHDCTRLVLRQRFFSGVRTTCFCMCMTGRPLNQRFPMTYTRLIFSMRHFMHEMTKYNSQPKFFNGAHTTYFCMRMTQANPQPTFFNDVVTTYFCMRDCTKTRDIYSLLFSHKYPIRDIQSSSKYTSDIQTFEKKTQQKFTSCRHKFFVN